MTNTEFINALQKQLDDMVSEYKSLGAKRDQLSEDMIKIMYLIDNLKEETDGQ